AMPEAAGIVEPDGHAMPACARRGDTDDPARGRRPFQAQDGPVLLRVRSGGCEGGACAPGAAVDGTDPCVYLLFAGARRDVRLAGPGPRPGATQRYRFSGYLAFHG